MDSSASLAFNDGICVAMRAVTVLHAQDRAKTILDAKVPTVVEMQRAELSKCGLPPTKPLDTYLQSLSCGLC